MKEINCPCCEDGELRYVDYNGTHIWVCDKCPIVMFEYYVCKNTETVMYYLEKEN